MYCYIYWCGPLQQMEEFISYSVPSMHASQWMVERDRPLAPRSQHHLGWCSDESGRINDCTPAKSSQHSSVLGSKTLVPQQNNASRLVRSAIFNTHYTNANDIWRMKCTQRSSYSVSYDGPGESLRANNRARCNTTLSSNCSTENWSAVAMTCPFILVRYTALSKGRFKRCTQSVCPSVCLFVRAKVRSVPPIFSKRERRRNF